MVTILVLIVLYPSKSKGQSQNFSGIWKLNISKSEFNGLPTMAACEQIKIEQTRDSIFTERSYIEQGGSKTLSKSRRSIDGRTNLSETSDGVTRKATVIWSKEKAGLVLATIYTKPGLPNEDDYTLTSIWQLNNNTLTEEFITPNYTIRAIYDKATQ